MSILTDRLPNRKRAIELLNIHSVEAHEYAMKALESKDVGLSDVFRKRAEHHNSMCLFYIRLLERMPET